MIEETSAAEIQVNSDKAVMAVRLKGETPTNGKRTETVPESLVEGGVIMPNHPSVITHPNADTVENTATIKRSAGKGTRLGITWPTPHKLRIKLRLRR